EGRGDRLGAAQDQAGVRQPAARAGAGRGERMSVAIVTGGASGIGAAIVRAMLDAGTEVVVLARQAPQETHAKLHALEVDLFDNAALAKAAGGVAARFKVTHLVHNAGTIRPA